MVATLQFGRGQESDVDGYWSHHANAPSFIPATEAHFIRFYFYTSDDFRTLATVNGAPTLKTRDTRFPHSRPSLWVANKGTEPTSSSSGGSSQGLSNERPIKY